MHFWQMTLFFLFEKINTILLVYLESTDRLVTVCSRHTFPLTALRFTLSVIDHSSPPEGGTMRCRAQTVTCFWEQEWRLHTQT